MIPLRRYGQIAGGIYRERDGCAAAGLVIPTIPPSTNVIHPLHSIAIRAWNELLTGG